MGFTNHVKSVIWIALCAFGACCALEYSFFDAFYIAPALQYSPIAAVVTAVFIAVLFACSYKTASMRIGAVVCAVAAVGMLVFCASSAPDGNYLKDQEGNVFFWAVVVIAVTALCFICSRRRTTAVLFFAGGAFACAWTQFFYQRYAFGWLLLFLACALGMIALKSFEESALTVKSMGKLSFTAAAATSIAAVLLAVGCACGVWFLVIQPLHPGAFTIELVNEDRSLQEEEVKGIGGIYLTPNMELTSDQTTDSSRTTDDLKIDENGEEVPAHLNSTASSKKTASGTQAGLDDDSTDNSFDEQTDQLPQILALIIAIVVIALILAYFIGRRVVRRVRLQRILKMEPNKQVGAIFLFLITRFERLGMRIPNGTTVTEFANSNPQQLGTFDERGGCSLASITECYSHITYGKGCVSTQTAQQCADYYRGFWKAAREYLGTVKYFFKSFRL